MSEVFKIKQNDPLAKELLYEGRHPDYPGLRAYLMEVLENQEVELVFDLRPKENINGKDLFKRFLSALRLYSLPASLGPAILAFLYAWSSGLEPQWLLSSAALLALLFMHIAVNVLNDVQDYLKLIDAPGTYGGSGVILKGWFSSRFLQRVGVLFFVVGLSLGLGVLFYSPIELLFVIILAVAGVLLYSNGPFPFKYKALGDLAVFVTFGPALTAGMSLASFGVVYWPVVWLGAVFGLAAVALLHVNNMEDIVIDEKRGARTLASTIGFRASCRLLAALYVLIPVLAFSMLALSIWPWTFAVAGILSFLVALPVMKKAFQSSGPLSPHMHLLRLKAAQTHGKISLIFFAAIVLYFWVQT